MSLLTQTTMHAAVMTPDKSIRVCDLIRPEIPSGGALVRVLGCGLCGSDLDKWAHRQTDTAIVLGHEVVGVLDTLSPEAQKQFPHLLPGQRVAIAHHVPCQQCHYCLHGSPSMCPSFKESNILPGGFAQYIAITDEHLAHTVFPLPDHLSDSGGSCIEPLACCIRAIDRLPSEAGSSLAIIGLGFIGLLTAQYAKLRGLNTYGLDLKPDRVSLGVSHQMIHRASDSPDLFVDTLHQATQGRGADMVFLSVVTPATIELALKSVRNGGTIMLFASSAQNTPLINQNTLYFREITVMTSYSPSLTQLQLASDLIISQQIQVEPLISHQFPLEQLVDAFKLYQKGEALKAFITV